MTKMHVNRNIHRSAAMALLLAAAGLLMVVDDGLKAEERASLKQEATAAMRRAAEFYRGQVASHGGYVYYYSPDLSRRWGEGEATPDQIWVQPPGTPTVGLAYLEAYAATKDDFYREAARETAEALIYGQLKSGGWTNCVDFAPGGARVALYRNGRGGGRNMSSLDDGTSQAALRFLIRADEAFGFKNDQIHEAAQFGLSALLKAQFPNGAFPQGWLGPVSPQPVVKASYPEYNWQTEGRIKNYWDMYTLNDGLAGTMAATLLDAFDVYQDEKYKAALVRLGDFLVLAQMPEPQPAWAQQYNYNMQPIWARRFEPAAITGGESQDVMETLLLIHRVTRDARYLAPIPPALAYLKRSSLSDGRLARYYELKTNRPLYMERRGDAYSLTFDDTRLPDHYGWKVDSRLAQIEQAYRDAAQSKADSAAPAKAISEEQVRKVLAELDEQGRWVSAYKGERLVGQPKFAAGTQFISSDVFSRNLTALSRFLKPRP